jgi:phosphonate transport system substrate-binding protein
MRFGMPAVQDRAEIKAQWTPLVEAMAARLGRPIDLHISTDYAGTIWALREGTDSIGWLGNKSAIEAVDNANCEVFARLVFTEGGAGYHSVLIIRADLPFATPSEILAHAGQLTLGLGDTNSTSGYLIPAYYLFARNGVTARSVFKRVIQANHEANVQAVIDGRVDAATVASNTLELILKQHPEFAPRVRVAWQSPEIPSDPLVWRRSLPDEVKEQVRAFLLDFGNAAPGKPSRILAKEQHVLARAGITRFIASDDRQLVPVRRVELLHLREAIEGDEGMDPGERERKLAAVNAKLVALDGVEDPRTR